MRFKEDRLGWKNQLLRFDNVVMDKLKIVTTSWDDGDPKDIRLAELLAFRGIRGTFYVPTSAHDERKTLSPTELKALSSESFEVGAHTVSHKSLPTLTRNELVHEVSTCKHILEQTLGREVIMFCYPKGRYDSEVIREVQKAGYKGARTIRMLCLKTEFLPFEMPTSVQAYPHSRVTYLKNQGKAKSISGLVKYLAELRRFEKWVDLGKRLFDEVLQHGGIWHLYGHSWEIDELGIWDDLSEMLDYVAHRKGVTYATNGQLLSLVNRVDGVSSLNARLEQCPRSLRDKEKQIPCPR